MLRKILAYWSVALPLIAFSQCDRCTRLFEDITPWKLLWDKAELLNTSLPAVDVAAGITCHVPSEEAVYFLNPTGACWKFTQTPEGGFTYDSIASVPGITGQATLFVFPAGSTQEQTLHVGILDKQHVTLTRYNGTAWESVANYELNLEALQSGAKGTACSIHEEEQLNGLIVLKPNKDQQPVVLIYDAAKQTLEPSSTWECPINGTPNTAIEIAPGLVLWGGCKRPQKDLMVGFWSKALTSKSITSYVGVKPERMSLFLLQTKELMKKAVLVLYTPKNEKTELEFYTLEGDRMQPSGNLPEALEETEEEGVDNRIDHSESLVLPFSEVAYVVTKNKDGRLVYYKGSLQDPTKQAQEEEQDDPKAKEQTSE